MRTYLTIYLLFIVVSHFLDGDIRYDAALLTSIVILVIVVYCC